MMAVVVLKLSFSKERKIFFVIAGLKNEYIWFMKKKKSFKEYTLRRKMYVIFT